MNLKNKKILTLLGVGFITALTTGPSLLQAEASLTRPTTYHYFYAPIDNPSPAPDHWRLADWNGSSSPNSNNDTRYTRTADGAYYNYSLTLNNSTDSFLPDGLEITMTFNRSNTSWTQVSGTSLYNPTDYTKIGSNNSVGTISKKASIKITNNTNNDYLAIFDFSSTQNVFNFQWIYNTSPYNEWYLLNFRLFSFLISSGNVLEVTPNPTNGLVYFDAWYLQDLGLSDAYTEGYDTGQDDGYDTGYEEGYELGLDEGYVNGQDDADLLVTGFTAMVGILVNFVLMIVNLEVLGVSLLGIFSIIVLFTGIVWVLKLIRG